MKTLSVHRRKQPLKKKRQCNHFIFFFFAIASQLKVYIQQNRKTGQMKKLLLYPSLVGYMILTAYIYFGVWTSTPVKALLYG